MQHLHNRKTILSHLERPARLHTNTYGICFLFLNNLDPPVLRGDSYGAGTSAETIDGFKATWEECYSDCLEKSLTQDSDFNGATWSEAGNSK